jgi:phytoene dehydrogenase-like protein
MADYDVLVIGAGHNGLVCAGYLAKAGYRVGIIERRHKVGGAVVTEEIVPGFKFDLGGSAHLLINHTPIVDDLNLTRYGLHYINVDPLFFAPFPDGSQITIWRDIDKTCESIAAVCPEDAEIYRQFVNRWWEFSEGMVDSFLNPPTPGNIFKHVVMQSKLWRSGLSKLNDIRRGYGPLLKDIFKSEKTQAVIAWMAGQSGPPPNEPFSAPLALWFPMYHVSGMRRPRGGSGMLTQALANMIKAHGGEIFVDSPATQILTANGRAVGVETANGTRLLVDNAVVSAAHIHTTIKLLGDAAPGWAKKRVNNVRVGNGIGMITRYAMNELPNYHALPSDDGQPQPHHGAIQFICPSVDYLDRAYRDYERGQPSRRPALAVMTSSAVDPTIAPPDKHVMFLWGQYYPYQLASGESWDDIGKRESDRMLQLLAEYAPNVEDAVIDELIETPLYLERTLGLKNGHIMHLEMSSDQMFLLRPAIGMGTYRGPVDGLYLTGASTHPGGGIMGASGRNAAHVIQQDTSSRNWFGWLPGR